MEINTSSEKMGERRTEEGSNGGGSVVWMYGEKKNADNLG